MKLYKMQVKLININTHFRMQSGSKNVKSLLTSLTFLIKPPW